MTCYWWSDATDGQNLQVFTLISMNSKPNTAYKPVKSLPFLLFDNEDNTVILLFRVRFCQGELTSGITAFYDLWLIPFPNLTIQAPWKHSEDACRTFLISVACLQSDIICCEMKVRMKSQAEHEQFQFTKVYSPTWNASGKTHWNGAFASEELEVKHIWCYCWIRYKYMLDVTQECCPAVVEIKCLAAER